MVKPENNLKYHWGDVITKVYQLTSKFKSLIKQGDRVSSYRKIDLSG